MLMREVSQVFAFLETALMCCLRHLMGQFAVSAWLLRCCETSSWPLLSLPASVQGSHCCCLSTVHGLKSGKMLKEFRGHTSYVNCAIYSPDGSQVHKRANDDTFCKSGGGRCLVPDYVLGALVTCRSSAALVMQQSGCGTPKPASVSLPFAPRRRKVDHAYNPFPWPSPLCFRASTAQMRIWK